MSNTATLFASLVFANTTGGSAQMSAPSTSFSVTGDHFAQSIFSVPTTAGGTAIPLGGVNAAGGFFFIKNNDPTNYVQILNAVSGTVLLRLNPGEFAMGRFDAGVTAPAALAHTAAVEINYLILDA